MTEVASSTVGRDNLILAWRQPPGLVGWVTAFNHKPIGRRFIITGLVFFLIGGVMAILVRSQLVVPENTFLAADIYNQLFTMHGTTMMFLFAVPVLEGLAVYLMPLMLGTRDLPFPRLGAFGYWLYLFGGIFVYASFLAGQVPEAGWFAYVPLSGEIFSPDQGMDFWLLGITMVEISGILGALELIVLFLRRRAPGMSLSRVPLFAWAVTVMSAMMVLAFPVLVAASTMLELERGTPLTFFDPSRGGDPLLWQHLFWFFGHPEVYIMLLPAAGMVSMIIPVFSRRTVAGYGWIVAALVAIGIASFGLWVHHMFAVGLPPVSTAAFTAASILIAIPSGVLVFAWLATLWRGKPTFDTPVLFVIGAIAVFVIGGITGVMVATVPFDLQVHDSFFVVAHFHYVLLGGVVFPTFAALYYWFPKFTGRATARRAGKYAFWTMFAGVNLAFFPQHFLGLQGMPRRIFTYEVGLGWELGNALSTIGAFVLAIGVGVAFVDFIRARRSGPPAGPDPWGGGTLEWLADSPPAPYNFEVIPVVSDKDPLWSGDSPDPPQWDIDLSKPSAPVREVVDTSPLDAEPEEVVTLPGPSWFPLVAAATLTATLIAVLASSLLVSAMGGVVLLLVLVAWAASDPGDIPEADLGQPPTRASIGVWGLVVGLVSWGMVLAALAVSFFYLLVVPLEPAPAPEADSVLLVIALILSVVLLAVATLTKWGVSVGMGGNGVIWLMVLAVALSLTLTMVGVAVATGVSDVSGSSAPGSVGALLAGFGALSALALTGGSAATAIRVARESETSNATRAVRISAAFVLVVWAVIAVAFWLAPMLGS